MKKIGGFFELELQKGDSLYHDNAIKLTTGRACLNYILKSYIPNKVYVPFYCCDALFEPMIINDIEYEFYSINNKLEIDDLPKLKNNEIIIYTDFFGVKSHYTNKLIDIYKNQLIIDNTHSFFSKEFRSENASFTSARKYFGVPDGAFLYIPENLKSHINMRRNNKVSAIHNIHSLLGQQNIAYAEYVEHEKSLGSEIEEISILSEILLSSLDYAKIRDIRNRNFNFLRIELNQINKLVIDENEKDSFCYPLLLSKPILKKELYKENIFIPNLWLDTTKRDQSNDFDFECRLSTELLPLPIDHRYSIADMKRVIKVIKNRM